MNTPLDKTANQPESTPTWLIVMERFGRLLFALATIGMGVATLIVISGHSPGSQKFVRVIPWPDAIPGLVYPIGAILLLCGVGLLFRRSMLVSSIILGALMLLCGLAFDVPRHPNLMSPEWRTNVLEPIVIGCLAWLAAGGIPGWLHTTGRYLIALSLIVFGIAHFQVLTPIATMVPGWIPWHQFWVAFTGVAFIAAGVSFATGCLQRWATLGLGLMFAIWLVTVHLPPVLNYLHNPGAPQDPDKWSDVFIVAALWGGFWALARASRSQRLPAPA